MRQRVPATHCFVCDKATREGKPYCIDHVLVLGYPSFVSRAWDAIVEERERLNEAVLRREKVVVPDPSLLVRECLLVVLTAEATCSRGRIARELGLELEAVVPLAKAAGLTAHVGERTVLFNPEEAKALLDGTA